MLIDENAIKARNRDLRRIISQKRKALLDAPEGFLRIDRKKNKKTPQYYRRESTDDLNGIYIPVDQKNLVVALAQKQYDKQVLKIATEELDSWKMILQEYPKKQPEMVYETLSPDRQSLVKPAQLLDEEFIEKWRNEPFKHLSFSKNDAEFYTDRGERVRSKSELIIANTLNRLGIVYVYEKPLKLPQYGIKYPDFTILLMPSRKVLRLEHLGMMDDPVYVEKQIEKFEEYILSGYYPGEDIIVTWETKNHPLETPALEAVIKHYLL